MSLSFKFIPLTFLNDDDEIKKQIRNTIILKYFFERNSDTVHLEDLITGTQYGYNASALVQGRNKFLRISDITDGKVNWKTVPYCNCSDEKTYLLFPNDILIARTGGTTGKSFLISEPPSLSIYAGYLIRIRANEETNPNYLNLFLNSYVYWSQIVSLNEDNFRPSVNANKLKKLILPKCDETTQNDAVKISNGDLINGYDDLYKLIEETLLKYDKIKEIQFERESQLEYQKKIKHSILLEAIKGKLTEKWRDENPNIESASKLFDRIKKEKSKLIKEKKIKKEKDLASINNNEISFKLPKSWLWCRLADLCSKTGSGSTPTGGKTSYLSEGIQFLRSQNIYDTGLQIDGIAYISEKVHIQMNGSKVLPNDLLLNITGGSIGRCAIVPSQFENGNINQHVAIIRPIFLDFGFFLHKVIISNYFQKEIIKAQTGAGREGLPKNKMDEILIPLPPLDEQQVIINKVETLMKSYEALEKEILGNKKLSNNLLQAVLKEAFEVKEEVLYIKN